MHTHVLACILHDDDNNNLEIDTFGCSGGKCVCIGDVSDTLFGSRP